MKDDATFNHKDATHGLKCAHSLGGNTKVYYMFCIPLEMTRTRKQKVIVFGNLFWGGDNHRIRYVDPGRIVPLSELNLKGDDNGQG